MNTKNTPAPVSEPHPDALPDGTFSRSTMKRRELLIPGEISSKLVDAASGEGCEVEGIASEIEVEAAILNTWAVAHDKQHIMAGRLEKLAQRVRRLTTTGQGDVDRLVEAAREYFTHYCEDEAADQFHGDTEYGWLTGCSRAQHEDAKALREALAPFGQQQEGQG